VVADGPATAAATTTTNRVVAAPCVITARNVSDGRARAVVINSGNANACTGPDGLHDAETTTEIAGRLLGVAATDVLVCSTGVIGVPLPMAPLVAGLPRVVADLSTDGGGRAARAILTTDSVDKQSAYRVEDATGACTVGGIAKGAGMIEPAMATMLAVVTTDAPLTPAVLRPMLKQVVARTFNRISVDACGSTNDTVVVLASGHSQHPPTLATFRNGLEAVCADLARAIVADGEGTSKVAELTVSGAAREHDAVTLARAIAASDLFRAALAGADPNWGRVLAAMGTTEVDFDPARVSVAFGGVAVCRFGVATGFDRGLAAAALSRPVVEITVDLGGRGEASATFLTADLTPDYVRLNSEYTT
ncbi:MAG TPA: bifunctional glutamate N-acetyltransferase/amino-acid acetyltransferase ArgJ, partial [Nitriliruptorales bacterium]|nr:bifunctional glutamate N-acetyltransferase/amino-acid acetyltransferase ArgJ [Nitriliruptorales bacterium]